MFHAKINISKKQELKDFISSLIPVSTKDLYFGRVEKITKKKNYFLKLLKPSYVVIHKKKSYLGETIFEDALKGNIYNNEKYIKTDRLFGSEETIIDLFPVKTEKAYISRKTLETMFNKYINIQKRKRLCVNLNNSGVRANEKAA